MSRGRHKELVVEAGSELEAREALELGADAVLVPAAESPDLAARSYVFERNLRIAKVRDQSDVEALRSMASSGVQAVLVEPEDLKVIALENVIAALQGSGVKVLARVRSLQEVELVAGALESGVDGLVVGRELLGELKVIRDLLSTPQRLELREAEVREVVGLGLGERACVDTTSILRVGEGMLVGNMSRMLFLVHSESVGSRLTPPRPFRVNAGSVHCYVLAPGGRTNYLSELRSGSRVLAVSRDGRCRVVSVGRVKVERRPLANVVAEVDGMTGSVALQAAETIRLVSPDGELLDVTSISEGDRVLVWTSGAAARHMGTAVDEFIEEV
ncbi:MAG: 3-dehydroquinate synthase II [Thaumarchaeota archaeon]|nr:3-dehydroquinate synthase II [Candidatus Calditenuaceae archaeon]MDW8043028.1 3-dehydroquinate synthase II [Nitrososphaerota archaeon]